MMKKNTQKVSKTSQEKTAIRVAASMAKLLNGANMTLLPVVTIVNGQIKTDIQLVFKQ